MKVITLNKLFGKRTVKRLEYPHYAQPRPLWPIKTTTIKYMKGLSAQVKLFPICYEEGSGITLTDVDGNKFHDFSFYGVILK